MSKIENDKKNGLSANEYVEGILKRDITFISKAITLVESTLEEDVRLSQGILECCLPHSGRSIRIGITGIPGVGKSTFIDTFGSYLTGKCGKKVAVLAVDPTSQISKGSILGDKTRMESLFLVLLRPHQFGLSFCGGFLTIFFLFFVLFVSFVVSLFLLSRLSVKTAKENQQIRGN